jgi:hypothetical protein
MFGHFPVQRMSTFASKEKMKQNVGPGDVRRLVRADQVGIQHPRLCQRDQTLN